LRGEVHVGALTGLQANNALEPTVNAHLRLVAAGGALAAAHRERSADNQQMVIGEQLDYV